MPEQGFEGEEKDELLVKITQWKSRSENARRSYDDRWATNLKLFKGIFDEEETTRSKVRKRSKIYYRKIWATNWRLAASFAAAFLKDENSFKVGGRGPEDDHRAAVLTNMTEYRKDVLYRKHSLYIKLIWSIFNVINYGWSVGRLSWQFNEDTGQDEPIFTLYPNEQVFPDLNAETKEQMRYITYVSYLSKEDLEDMGYENIDEAETTTPESNPLRSARFATDRDPLQNPGENEYPKPGRYRDGETDSTTGDLYEVWETFYKEKGKIKFVVTNKGNVFFKKVEDSRYGDRIPCIMGHCLTEAHKLIGEGFPESLEGAQTSINFLLNTRKDNIALSLSRGALVSRNAHIDLQSIVNRRPGSVTLTSDINGVKWDEIPDVTRTAYIEAAADEAMISEMSGVTPGKQGLGTESKATVAQINFSESNAKIDLFLSIYGETFYKDFFSELSRLIQLFETDETVFKIANDKFRADTEGAEFAEDVFNLDFDADIEVSVGAGTVGRDIEIKQLFLAMDRAAQSNAVQLQLAASGIVNPKNVRLFDIAMFMEQILPKLGQKNVNKFFINMQQAQLPAEAGGVPGQGGGSAPLGLEGLGTTVQDVQAGGGGGI